MAIFHSYFDITRGLKNQHFIFQEAQDLVIGKGCVSEDIGQATPDFIKLTRSLYIDISRYHQIHKNGLNECV